MTLRKSLIGFAIGGLLIPVAFEVGWWILNSYDIPSLDARLAIQKSMFLLWPSSIVMLGAGGEPDLFWRLFALSAGANVLLYLVIGFLVWLSFSKSYLYLLPVPLIMVPIWWQLFTL